MLQGLLCLQPVDASHTCARNQMKHHSREGMQGGTVSTKPCSNGADSPCQSFVGLGSSIASCGELKISAASQILEAFLGQSIETIETIKEEAKASAGNADSKSVDCQSAPASISCSIPVQKVILMMVLVPGLAMPSQDRDRGSHLSTKPLVTFQRCPLE